MSEPTPSQVSVSRAARRLMAEKAWTQRQLSEALDMKVSTLRDKIYGYRRWSLDDVDALALLGADVPAFGVVVVRDSLQNRLGRLLRCGIRVSGL